MSKDLNRCTFIGNLVRDPESRSMPDGTASCKFILAVNDDYKNRDTGEKTETAEFVQFSAIGKLAEICSTYLKKGKQIYAEGRFKTRKWTDKEGVERYSSGIQLENMQMLGGRGDDAGRPANGYRNSPGYQPSPSGSRHPSPNYNDDIPF